MIKFILGNIRLTISDIICCNRPKWRIDHTDNKSKVKTSILILKRKFYNHWERYHLVFIEKYILQGRFWGERTDSEECVLCLAYFTQKHTPLSLINMKSPFMKRVKIIISQNKRLEASFGLNEIEYMYIENIYYSKWNWIHRKYLL